jgi:hypothetical protein
MLDDSLARLDASALLDVSEYAQLQLDEIREANDMQLALHRERFALD